ncbi:Ribosome biogenesis protein YTM1 [Abortiporus biennis]
MSSSTTERTHPVLFTTQTTSQLPSSKFMIPVSWKRYQLSQLINKALGLGGEVGAGYVPFDFLIRGEILRSGVSLDEWCKEKAVPEEETLEIEYFESVMPPQKMSSLPHEDWVSDVECQLPGYFLTSSYDGRIRLFNYSQNLLHTIHSHEAPATCLTLIPSTTSTSTSHIIASGSLDSSTRITKISKGEEENWNTEHLASLPLHTAPISSISSNPTGTLLLTSSWDGLVGVWDTKIPSSDEVPATSVTEGRKKRRRVQEDGEEGSGEGKRKAPVNVLKSHQGRVSKAIFASGEGEGRRAYSVGFDSSIRVWDVEIGVCVDTITASNKPFLSLSQQSSSTILASSTDRTVSLYDIRLSSSSSSLSNSPIQTFLHPNTPSCITTPSTSSNQFISGSYDGIVRLWDLRSQKSALTSFKAWSGGEGSQGAATSVPKKVLSVDWNNGEGLVGIGGEGGFEVWKVSSSTNPGSK